MKPQIKVSDLQDYFEKHMYGFDSSVFAYAWNNNQNVLLSGPGGHGKSQAAVLFFKYLVSKGIYTENDVPFIQSFNPETTTEKILGGVNIKEFTSKGVITYNYENSFLSHRFVVFEEMLDASSSALMVLKDILTSKYHRDGDKFYPLKCDIVIGITNMKPEEFIENDSTQALLERFPYQMEVKWRSYIEDDYIKAYETASGKKASIIVRTVANAAAATYKPNEGYRPVSPRTFMIAVESCSNCEDNHFHPLLFMNYPGGFSPEAVRSAINNYHSIMKDEEESQIIQKYVEDLNSITEEFKIKFNKATKTLQEDDLLETYNVVKKVYDNYVSLANMKVRDVNSNNYKSLLVKLRQYYKKVAKILQDAIPNDVKNNKLERFKNNPIEEYEW